MVSVTFSYSLFGMVRYCVMVLVAIIICNLLLISAQSTPNADPLHLPAANEYYATSDPHLHHPASLSQPSSYNDVSQLRMNPGPEKVPSSDGSHKMSSEVETELEHDKEEVPAKRFFFQGLSKRMVGSRTIQDFPKRFIQGFVGSRGKRDKEGGGAAPARRVVRSAVFNDWKRMDDGEISAEELTKRFIQGFIGSRGKRGMEELAKRFTQGFVGSRGKRGMEELAKRFTQGFVGSRGKRGMEELAKRFTQGFVGSRGKRGMEELAKRFTQGFVGSRGKRGMEEKGEEEEQWKRFNPSGFSASRGKRYMSGLEALLLSQVYKKLDAEKWKRESMLGFHASRG
ncbi:uncharacterized protein LOC143290399 isoform X2 [Babylonia areolata]|uniref:uncharacterized protein LOC143290399 isoform X2 n=1 Tax=Babylonia areolata TaxID=304850 RepID=UPI003FD050A4